jgi:hypothetical protein
MKKASNIMNFFSRETQNIMNFFNSNIMKITWKSLYISEKKFIMFRVSGWVFGTDFMPGLHPFFFIMFRVFPPTL